MTKTLQERVEEAIRETLKDPEGAGSDLTVIDEYDNWIFVDGNLDVEDLASHIIETVKGHL